MENRLQTMVLTASGRAVQVVAGGRCTLSERPSLVQNNRPETTTKTERTRYTAAEEITRTTGKFVNGGGGDGRKKRHIIGEKRKNSGGEKANCESEKKTISVCPEVDTDGGGGPSTRYAKRNTDFPPLMDSSIGGVVTVVKGRTRGRITGTHGRGRENAAARSVQDVVSRRPLFRVIRRPG